MMKKYILILCTAICSISLTAFVIMNGKSSEAKCERIEFQSEPEFVYEINNRFANTITKERLDRSLTARDLLPEKEVESIASFHNIKITLFSEDRKDWEVVEGDDELLTKDQINLLDMLDYGSSFSLTGNIKRYSDESESLTNDTLVYYFSMIPHSPAKYVDGKYELINYLKKNSREEISMIDPRNLRPGKISFTVDTNGKINKVSLESTSGYDQIDQKMVKLIQDTPGSWKSASNANGDPVTESLTFFFGLIGC